MIIITGLTIKIHKCNSAGFSLHLTGEELPEDGTLARFRVKKAAVFDEPVIEKVVAIMDNTIDIDILKEDTKDLVPGDYLWNVAILFDGDDPYTLLEPAPPFIILPEDGGR